MRIGGALAAVAVLSLAAACGSGGVSGSGQPQVTSGPGWAVVDVPQGVDAPHLRVDGAVITLGGPDGPASLSFTIRNSGAVGDHLATVRSAEAGQAELVATGSATAAPQERSGGVPGTGIPVPAGATTPVGGASAWHVVFGTTGTLRPGSTSTVLLDFSLAREVSLPVPVRAA